MPFGLRFRRKQKIAISHEQKIAELEPKIIDALKTVHDPEIPVNIYELGLIYDVIISEQANVHIKMTLTTPHCPEAQSIPARVEQAVKSVPGVSDVVVEIVWDPPWTQEKMSEVARLELGLL